MTATIHPIRELITVEELKQRLRIAIDNSARPPLLDVQPDGTIIEIDNDARFRTVCTRIARLMEDYATHGGEAYVRAHALAIDLYREGLING